MPFTFEEPDFLVVVAVVPVGFETEDTVCELVFKAVVAASLVSFSSFADILFVEFVSAELSEAVAVTVSGLNPASSVCQQPDSSILHTAKIVIAFFIAFTPINLLL